MVLARPGRGRQKHANVASVALGKLDEPDLHVERVCDVRKGSVAVGARVLMVEGVELGLFENGSQIVVFDDDGGLSVREDPQSGKHLVEILDVREDVGKGDYVRLPVLLHEPLAGGDI